MSIMGIVIICVSALIGIVLVGLLVIAGVQFTTTSRIEAEEKARRARELGK